jgi:hypothetical protein
MSKVKTEASQKASLKSNQKAVSKENVEMAIKSKSKQTAKKVSSNIAMAKPPLAVRKLLTELFPEVKPKEIEWGWEIPHKIYEAEFMLDGISHEVEITVTGHHLLTEQNIPVDLVPLNLQKEVKAKYKPFTIDSAEIVSLGNGKMHYELDLKSKKDEEITKTILVWPNGVIREESDDTLY